MLSYLSTLTHATIATNGVNLHVATVGTAGQPLVILLHGFPEFWYGWRKQLPALLKAGYRVFVPDQRGYNLSDKPQGLDAYNLDQLALDVVGLIDISGVDRAYIVGHDWGAMVAWWVALKHPDRVKKLAILNVPHPKTFGDTLRSNPAQILKSWYAGFFQLPALPELMFKADGGRGFAQTLARTSNPGSFSDSDLKYYREAWAQPGATTAMLNWYRAYVQCPPAPPSSWQVRVPTLIQWGANDVALTRQMAEDSLAYCDDGRLILYDDATHWLQHDKPQAVNARLVEFLR